jgi:hypothetical protein
MRLLHISEPFDHPAFMFEPKLDGVQAPLLVLETHDLTVCDRCHPALAAGRVFG